MKVRCIDNGNWEDQLNLGQTYTVIKEFQGNSNGRYYTGKRYLLKDVHTSTTGVFVERFEIVSGCPCDVAGCIAHRDKTNG